MSLNLPPVPRPQIADKKGVLEAPWQSWFSQLFNYVTANKLKNYVSTNLPSAVTAGPGARFFVTDANATTFASIVAGGGTNGVPVYSDGTNWRIG